MASLLKRLVQKFDACDIEIVCDGKDLTNPKQTIEIEDPFEDPPVRETYLLYQHTEPIKGFVRVSPHRKLNHRGIRVELIGQVTTTNEREERFEFLSDSHLHFESAATAGENLEKAVELPFNFTGARQYESYRGLNARVQYIVRATVVSRVKNVVGKQEMWVKRVEEENATEVHVDESKNPVWEKQYAFPPGHVSMDVGVDELLHIEFKYDKARFHLKERVLGQVTFKLVQLNLQFGEVSVVRREIIGTGESQYHETETLQKYEIMDGTPIANEVVPIRLYLASIPRLTPTYDVERHFQVKYYINLVLVTVDGKRYFKQQEIQLVRMKGQ